MKSLTPSLAATPARTRAVTHILVPAACVLFLLLSHAPLLNLPCYWDEAGQFVPAALDIYELGAWVPLRVTPNVHPPGVMAYLALVWQVFGYSIVATRVAMLALAAAGVWLAYLLAIRLSGSSGIAAALLLLASPLFYTQAMLAQLDMPAMVFTLLSLLLFLQGRARWAALSSVALVMVKGTGIAVPLALAAVLVIERRRREALWFALPVLVLAAWLLVLWKATGNLLGNAEFARYNVNYAAQPSRIALALARRCFTLFLENFHWIGWIAVVLAWRRTRIYATPEWRVTLLVAASNVAMVSVFGGAVLERYLLPVLPLMYVAFAAAWAALPSRWTRLGQAALFGGLIFSLFVSPPYPAPFENNLAMVDFIKLHQTASAYIERNMPGEMVTTAWPLAMELQRPRLGYVSRSLPVTEMPGFRAEDIRALDPAKIRTFALFSRDWDATLETRRGLRFGDLRRRIYGFEPPVSASEVERLLGVKQVARWEKRGQFVAVFRKP